MAYEGNEIAAMMAIRNQNISKAVEHLLGICTGLVADNSIVDEEVKFLDLWLSQYPDVTTSWPGKVIAERVGSILADGVITAAEQEDLLETLKGVCGFQLAETGSAEAAIASIPFDDDPSIYFDGRSFCFTGRFLFGTRAKCEREVLNRGSIATDRVTGNLEYLVVGSVIEPSWAHTSYGRKIEKAIDYIDKGHGIAIVSERQWIEALR
ncbi:MAG: hypothetical protein AzoDbin1_05318 [Azoarcus sp.]|nr:hypothetical protein [Azoarcus sp.]